MKFRTQKDNILKSSRSKLGRIIVLTGARQTGKTTLTKNIFKDYTFISIEDPVLREEYKRLTAIQWYQFYPKAVLDEVQKEPQLIESIKAVYDQFSDARYILLGSSQLLLLQKVKETLAGRCQIMELFPLTIPEIGSQSWEDEVGLSTFQKILLNERPSFLPSIHLDPQHANKIDAYQKYLKWGGYPALYDGELADEERKLWLDNYIKTYLERDIRDLADFKNLEPFVQVQKTSALMTGQSMNYSSLARNAGVHSKTAQRFMHYLEVSYQTITLQPWYKNTLKRLSKMPKIHYLDPGIQKSLTRSIQGELTGSEYESALIAEMYKQAKNIYSDASFYHLRTVDGREVDLLIELNEGYIAIEIKKTSRIHKTDARHLNDLQEILDKPLIHSYILSNDPQTQLISKEITAVHAALMIA
jgi:predicted AAA+ superfamily ATPase